MPRRQPKPKPTSPHAADLPTELVDRIMSAMEATAKSALFEDDEEVQGHVREFIEASNPRRLAHVLHRIDNVAFTAFVLHAILFAAPVQRSRSTRTPTKTRSRSPRTKATDKR